MNKIPVKIIVCIAALSTALAFTTCKSTPEPEGFREPKMSVQSVALSRVSFKGVELLCKLTVNNPNNFGITFPEIPWEFFTGNDQFTEGVFKTDYVVQARSSAVASIYIKVDYLELFKNSVSYVGRKNANYTVLFHPKMTIPDYGNRNWNFERKGEFPILEVPSINFRNIEVKNISLTRLDFELTLEVENPNNLDLTLNNLSYMFLVNNSRWSSGNVRNTPLLPAGRKTIIPISFSLNSLNVVLEITQIITRGTDVSYSFSGDLTYSVDLPGVKDLGNSINVSGMTRLKK